MRREIQIVNCKLEIHVASTKTFNLKKYRYFIRAHAHQRIMLIEIYLRVRHENCAVTMLHRPGLARSARLWHARARRLLGLSRPGNAWLLSRPSAITLRVRAARARIDKVHLAANFDGGELIYCARERGRLHMYMQFLPVRPTMILRKRCYSIRFCWNYREQCVWFVRFF